MLKPALKCGSCNVRNFELNWSASLPLDNGGALTNLPTDEDVVHF